MGMYDSLMVYCPNCDTGIEFQSKAGDQLLEMYNINNCPAIILSDLNEKHEPCDYCGHRAVLKAKTIAWVE